MGKIFFHCWCPCTLNFRKILESRLAFAYYKYLRNFIDLGTKFILISLPYIFTKHTYFKIRLSVSHTWYFDFSQLYFLIQSLIYKQIILLLPCTYEWSLDFPCSSFIQWFCLKFPILRSPCMEITMLFPNC